MNSERWQKVKEIFEVAVELAPSERQPYLQEACGSDAALLRDVENLLASFDESESFMEKPASAEVASLIAKPEDLTEGKTFAHYEVIMKIGAGGMGAVYLATDKRLHRQVAIKLLHNRFSRQESNLLRFKQEARAASGLNHPNILVIHEIGEAGDANYIVSEYIEGKTLREVVTSDDVPLKLSKVLDVSIQIARALAAAHAAGIVHRDIKPENVLIRPDGLVKVLDFGLAKLVAQKPAGSEDETNIQNATGQGMVLGTVNYMSPEQAKGEQVDQRSDIFSLGALIYELIAGKPPFWGATMPESLANLINAEPQPLARFADGVPDEMQRIVTKAIQKQADDRYQTVKDLQSDLATLRENLAFDERLLKTSSSENGRTASTVSVDKRGLPGNRGNWIAASALIILLLGIAGSAYYFFSGKRETGREGGRRSLAVLPFINASQDPNAEYLSDGITESIINNLSQLSNLKVMSRNSAFRFKNDQRDMRSIASQLGVEVLVTGDIRQVGDRLVINARLIDPIDDSQLWGHQYFATSADVISAQNEIAQAVAQNLQLKLTESDEKHLSKNYTENVEAYQLYIRGRFHVFKVTPPEVDKGIAYLKQAIEIDPNYALAYAGLSDAYRSLALGAEMLPTEFLPKAKAAANKAIDLDERLSEGYSTLAISIFWYDWDWAAAEEQYRRAIELNPNNAHAHMFYAHLLSSSGRHAEALAEVKRARELDPLFPFLAALEGQFFLHAGQTEEGLARLQKAVELEPNLWLTHLFMASAYIEKGMYAEAIASARKSRELSGGNTHAMVDESFALVKIGNEAAARELLREVLRMSEARYISHYNVALVYATLGESDKAIEWLEKGIEQRDPKMTFLKVDPKWGKLRSDPRFMDIMRRMNFD